MEIIMKSVGELKPYENNPRKNDDAVDKVAQSIKEFGFKVPIVIDKDDVIVTGHTRWKASIKLGLDEVPCIVANDLTDKQIKAFRLADNKTGDFSIWDNQKLLTELEDLGDIFTGFNVGEIFGEELNEKDNGFIDDIVNELGTPNYTINYKCRNEEEYKEIMEFILEIKEKYE